MRLSRFSRRFAPTWMFRRSKSAPGAARWQMGCRRGRLTRLVEKGRGATGLARRGQAGLGDPGYSAPCSPARSSRAVRDSRPASFCGGRRALLLAFPRGSPRCPKDLSSSPAARAASARRSAAGSPPEGYADRRQLRRRRESRRGDGRRHRRRGRAGAGLPGRCRRAEGDRAKLFEESESRARAARGPRQQCRRHSVPAARVDALDASRTGAALPG